MTKNTIAFIIILITISVSGFTVFADEAPIIEEEYIFVTNSRVNLRSDSNTESEILKLLNPNTQIEVIYYNEDGWSKVSYNELVGFIRSDLITKKSLNLIFEAGEVQLLEWSQIKDNIVTINTPIQVYDIKTGFTYYVQSFSNGLHADVETMTKDDTNIMLSTFGGTWSWEVRPVIITVNGVKIAASIHGMPHGGSTISGNGMNGHVCLHFKGSRVHNGNTTYNNELQTAVVTAYNSR